MMDTWREVIMPVRKENPSWEKERDTTGNFRYRHAAW
jgi:hypothetical protein